MAINSEIDSTETQTSHQKNRRNALARMQKDAGYKVQGFDLRDSQSRNAAYKELESLQRSAIANYKEWAKETINYTNFGSEGVSRNLKQYNDTYTMAMLVGVISPLEQGCTISSCLQTLLSYNIVKTLNPNLDMDSSRLFYNFKNTIQPMLTDFRQEHKILGTLFSGFGNTLTNSLSEEAGGKFAQTIDSHQDAHDIDSMYLTPRQVAALKLNFMEQYYSDLRSGGSDSNKNAMTQQYNAAISHLNAICNNGGYDMSIVAAEERYLVGLKIQQNPDYATIFAETSDPFGVRMDSKAAQNLHLWNGQFTTSDYHDFFGANDISTDGAFHVRIPMTRDELKDNIQENAEYFKMMQNYATGNTFIGTEAQRKQVLKSLQQEEARYLKSLTFMVKTDDIANIRDKAIKNYFNDCMSKANPDMTDFEQELNSVLTAYTAKSMNLDPDSMRNTKRRTFDKTSDEYKDMISRLSSELNVSEDLALAQKCVNLFQQDPKDSLSAYDYMLHAATNIRQGYAQHGSNREGYEHGDRMSSLREYFADLMPEDDNEDGLKF